MEGISANVYKGLRSYWKRRGYKRLDDAGPHEPGRFGPESHSDQVRGRRRRFWRLKIGRRMRLWRRIGSPKKWLIRLRDAYVKMMLNFANSGLGSGYGEPMGYGPGFRKGPIKEYDEKVIVEIYKSLVMAQGQLVPRQTAKLSSHSVTLNSR